MWRPPEVAETELRFGMTHEPAILRRFEDSERGLKMTARNKEARRDSAVRVTTDRLRKCIRTFRLKKTRTLSSP